eukprot:4771209-Ditylum_brightwellii.AAC.1
MQLLPSSNLSQGSSSTDSATHTSYAPPQQTLHCPSTNSVVLKGQSVKQGPASYAVAMTLLKGNALMSKYSQRKPDRPRSATCRGTYILVEELQYLKDFPVHNGNCIQPLNKDKLLDILEYRVPALWCREFTVQGFDPVDQGL